MAELKNELALRGLSKGSGAVRAVDGVSLDIGRGEFVTLLGPSGSGKTTLLMMIAGFVEPDAGEILLDGRAITALPPERREFGMVFQGYALFPHLSVADNVAFPLKVRGIARAESERRVDEVLQLVKLGGLERRLPREDECGPHQPLHARCGEVQRFTAAVQLIAKGGEALAHASLLCEQRAAGSGADQPRLVQCGAAPEHRLLYLRGDDRPGATKVKADLLNLAHDSSEEVDISLQ